MLSELAVTNLGVIAELRLVLAPGMTALTGETGAGKTLIIDAIDLLAGGRADARVVRSGADEATVEGRFVTGADEVVLRRVIPANGRSRAYVDGQMATVATLAEVASRHVDLYAQHAQHSLLSVAGQRSALDRWAGTDARAFHEARSERDAIARRLRDLGADAATREREIDLLRFQVTELDAAALEDPEEDQHLADEQIGLDDVAANRLRAQQALAALVDDGGALDAIGAAVGAMAGSELFTLLGNRLDAVVAEVDDVAAEVRQLSETIVEDPERLARIVERRQLLSTLRRRHGDGTLQGVIDEHRALVRRLAELEGADEQAGELVEKLDRAEAALGRAAAQVARVRRNAAPEMARAVEVGLHRLAMPDAKFEVRVGEVDPGDEVEMFFSANPGMPPGPLARIGSGGELARTMLALRLVAASAQETVIFDEVDAGVGGAAAVAVGEALAELGQSRQVLVVTHLAQVAAAADHQIVVAKRSGRGSTHTAVDAVAGEDRVVELSRMLSGQPDSDAARAHARELLDRTPGMPGDV